MVQCRRVSDDSCCTPVALLLLLRYEDGCARGDGAWCDVACAEHAVSEGTQRAPVLQAEAAAAKKAEEAAKKSTEDTADTLKDTVNDAVDKVFDSLSFLEPIRPAVRPPPHPTILC